MGMLAAVPEGAGVITGVLDGTSNPEGSVDVAGTGDETVLESPLDVNVCPSVVITVGVVVNLTVPEPTATTEGPTAVVALITITDVVPVLRCETEDVFVQ